METKKVKTAADKAAAAAKRAKRKELSDRFHASLETAEGSLLVRVASGLYRECERQYPKQVKVKFEMRESRGGVFHYGFELWKSDGRLEIVIRPGVIEFYEIRAEGGPPHKDDFTPEKHYSIFGAKPVVVEWADQDFDSAAARIISKFMGGEFPLKWFKYEE